jgi:glyoxylase-like metal-dependent hydrolase (beta-lactamase superfamily II)
MRELHPGLWFWQAPHPEWTPAERWPSKVSSYAVDDGARLILIDPQSVPDPLLARARQREPVILLTQPWHERDARGLARELGAAVFSPPADTAQDFIDKFHVTAEQAGAGSTDLAWLRQGEAEAHWVAAGDRLPIGVQAFRGREHNDLQLWLERDRAVVLGDTVVDFGAGLGLNEWLKGGVSHDEIKRRLRPLLDLPIELVLPTHGTPTDRAALEQILA